MAEYEDLLDDPWLAPKKRGLRSFIRRNLPAVATALLVVADNRPAVALRGGHGAERPRRRLLEAHPGF